MKLRPKFDREFLSVTNGQNYVTYGKKFLWNSKKIFPVNYMEMAVTYGEKSFMEQTPGLFYFRPRPRIYRLRTPNFFARLFIF